MKVAAIFRLRRILLIPGLCSRRRWGKLLRFPKWVAFIIATRVALPDSQHVCDFGPGVLHEVRAVCSNRQFDDGVLIFLLNKASGS